MTHRRARALPLVSVLLTAALLATGTGAAYADETTPTPAPSLSPTPSVTPSPAASPSPTASPTAAARAAAPAAAPTLTLAGGGPVRYDRTATLTATLRDASGQPLAGQAITLQRQDAGTWVTISTLTTGPDGAVATPAAPTGASTPFRVLLPATVDQPEVVSAPVDVAGYASATRTTLTAPTSVVDERAVRFAVTMRTTDDATGTPARVVLQRRFGSGAWRSFTALTLVDGAGSVTLRPRSTASYRAVGGAGRWWLASASPAVTVRITPPGTVVRLPSGSPQPRAMAAQPRSTTAGVGIVVSRLSDAQWRRMSGVSWHRGCPVGRAGLRSIELNYWAFDGYRRRGRLVVNANAVGKYRAAFTRLYAARVPIRRIYPSETFGYSAASHGANDRLAMRSDDTSAFNCRWVTGRPHVSSPHSTGYAVDINTWENPYLTRAGWMPNTWWPRRAFGLVAWRTQSATVVAIMRRSGFAWTYGVADSQHFDVRR